MREKTGFFSGINIWDVSVLGHQAIIAPRSSPLTIGPPFRVAQCTVEGLF